jgi:hypothetical protein
MLGGRNGNPVESQNFLVTEENVRLILFSLIGAALAHGAILSIPNTTVLGTDPVGPSFTVSGNFSASDTISISATGLVDLNFGDFTANAAGIITAPATTNTGNHPGETSPNISDPAVNYAALLIGNTTLGFFQAFPSNAANGLGNPVPPTTLFSTATLGSIGFGAGLSNGTILHLVVSDCNGCFGDNSGSFAVGSVPEPGYFGIVACALLAGLRFRLRKRS